MKIPRKHNSVYIYPNRYGFLFVGSFFLSVLLGATYENNMLFLFAFVQLGFLFVSILVTAGEIKAVEISSLQVQGGFPDESTLLKVLVTNNSRSEIQFSLSGERVEKTEVSVPAQQYRMVQIPYRLAGHRGAYSLQRVKLFTSGPFLFFNCWKYWYVQQEHYVFPRAIGDSLGTRRQGVDVANVSGLEDYTGSQSLSRISWRQFSRSGKLMVKAAEEGNLEEYHFDWDQVAKLETESALSQLAKWVCEAEELGVQYGLRLKYFQSPLGVGLRHRDQLLTELAKCKD